MVLYLALPSQLVAGSPWVRYVIPALELALLVTLAVTRPGRRVVEEGTRRKVAMSLTALVSLANAIALYFLIHQLLYVGNLSGRTLLYGALDVWWTNVIAFALWYWELDGGGPVLRVTESDRARDFAFVQMTDSEVKARGWRPSFVDYFYVAFTNSSAFSPTDTLPLTRRAKVLMLVQSTFSILTLLLVAARAVNILR
jgi:uncharacterized membrane protein